MDETTKFISSQYLLQLGKPYFITVSKTCVTYLEQMNRCGEFSSSSTKLDILCRILHWVCAKLKQRWYVESNVGWFFIL